MTQLTAKLLTANVLGVFVWLDNAQNLFGLLGAIVGFCSGVMLVCINWEKFSTSKPVRWLISKIYR